MPSIFPCWCSHVRPCGWFVWIFFLKVFFFHSFRSLIFCVKFPQSTWILCHHGRVISSPYVNLCLFQRTCEAQISLTNPSECVVTHVFASPLVNRRPLSWPKHFFNFLHITTTRPFTLLSLKFFAFVGSIPIKSHQQAHIKISNW